MKSTIKFEEQKLQELIVYIAAKNDGNSTFGRTKLNKLLFFCDFAAYARLGTPITGATYVHLPYGPCPREMPKVKKDLLDSRRAVERQLHFDDQQKLIALSEPDLKLFTAEEISLVDDIIERYWDYTATQISAVSHGFVGWDFSTDREEIPYYTALIPDSPEPIGSADMDRAKKRADELVP